ncbi:MAG: CDP-alcohol phosphatidyltransferase family protein, partial [Planctomycetota bacterium]
MSTEAPNPISTPDQPAASPLKRQLPNIITSIRMLMVVAFAALLEATPSGPDGPDAAALLAAAGLFVVAALSDALDGHLARRWNVISRFGRIMDPLADKLLVLTAFMYLASPLFEVDGMMLSRVAPWIVAVILGR